MAKYKIDTEIVDGLELYVVKYKKWYWKKWRRIPNSGYSDYYLAFLQMSHYKLGLPHEYYS